MGADGSAEILGLFRKFRCVHPHLFAQIHHSLQLLVHQAIEVDGAGASAGTVENTGVVIHAYGKVVHEEIESARVALVGHIAADEPGKLLKMGRKPIDPAVLLHDKGRMLRKAGLVAIVVQVQHPWEDGVRADHDGRPAVSINVVQEIQNAALLQG